jgi:hypothetical protein
VHGKVTKNKIPNCVLARLFLHGKKKYEEEEKLSDSGFVVYHSRHHDETMAGVHISVTHTIQLLS